MYYLKVNEELYPAEFAGKMVDTDWDRRESKTITFAPGFSVSTVDALLRDDTAWSIFEVYSEGPEGPDHETEYDNSAYSVRGDLIIHPSGAISVKMGKPTELEEAYELLYGGM